MSLNLVAMREEFSTLHTAAQTLIETAATETRELTAEEVAANENRFSRMGAIKSTIEANARLAALALAGDPAAAPRVEPGTDAPGRAEFAELQNDRQTTTQEHGLDRKQFSQAMIKWASSGEMERQFATITTATQSGVYLPREIGMPIIPTAANAFREAIAATGAGVLALVNTPTTADMKVPVVTGTAGGQVAETASSETENVPSLSESITLTPTTYQSGSVYYSNMALAAGTIDVVNNVTPTLAFEKELGLESVIAAAMIADAGITQVVTTATISGFTYANLVSLNRKPPKRFQSFKAILLSAEGFAAAEGLVDSQGRPVLVQDTQNQNLVRFNTTPVIQCDYLEAFGASKVVGLIISFVGFRLRDVDGVQLARYTQVPAKPNQTGFNLFAYHGYGYAVSAVAKLKTPAS